jgi:hypothetical protein
LTAVVGGIPAPVVDGGAFLTAVVGGIPAPVVDGGAFLTADDGGVFAVVDGGAFLTAVDGGAFLTAVVGGVFLTVVEGYFFTVFDGDFLGVVVGVVDEALAAFGAIPARPSDNAIKAVIFFISVLLLGGINSGYVIKIA